MIQHITSSFEHIQWVLNHLDLYLIEGEGIEVVKEMKMYYQNMDTYPIELLKTYDRFRKLMIQNPYSYQFLPQEALPGAEKCCIYAHSGNAYMVPITEDERKCWIPIGLYKEYKKDTGTVRKYFDVLKKEFYKLKWNLNNACSKKQIELDDFKDSLFEKRLGAKFMDTNRRNPQLIEKKFGDCNAQNFLALAIINIVFLVLMGIKKNSVLIGMGEILSVVYMCLYIVQLLYMQLYISRIYKLQNEIEQFKYSCVHVSANDVDFISIYGRIMPHSIHPANYVAGYSRIMDDYKRQTVFLEKEIKIVPRNWEYLVIGILLIVLALSILAG